MTIFISTQKKIDKNKIKAIDTRSNTTNFKLS